MTADPQWWPRLHSILGSSTPLHHHAPEHLRDVRAKLHIWADGHRRTEDYRRAATCETYAAVITAELQRRDLVDHDMGAAA